ncbi:MAG: AAA family ATPase, partial [Mycoplasmataceae bacterium]|nr:AAA family ATPase [Mycoplasmataceae bacterium]
MKKTPKDFVPTLISELSNEIEFCEEENIKLLSNIKNEELVEEELNDRRTHEEHIYSTAKAKRAEKYSNVLEQEWEITEIKSNVKEIVTQFKRKTTGFSSDLKAAKNELSKLSKPQKKKKNDKSPKKDNSKAIIDIKATISSIENILKEIEDKVLIVNEESKNKIDAFKKVIDRENAELSIMDKEIKNLKSNVSDVVNALLVSSNKITSMNEKTTKNSSRKLTLLKNQDIITEMNIETNIVLLEGTGSVDDRKKRVINISSFDNDKMYSNPKKYLDNCEWQVSDYDHGFATVIKRNNMAMFNLSNGNYKSPYLAIDLNNPTSKIKRLDTSLHGDLNEKQKEAFKMINNSYQASFLQGPPGTGKTQVISNIIAYYAEKGEVSLISSSTNEAINNALERINKDQFNNPNVFFLRVTNSKDQKEKAKEFLEDKIPFNFISKMIRFSKGEKEEESLANEIIENFSKEEINSYIPLVYFKKFKNKETVQSNAEFFSAFLDEPLEDAEYFYDDSVSKWNKLLRKTNTAIKNETSISTKIEKLYSTKLNEVNDCKVSTYDFISRYKNNSKGSMFDELVNDVMSSIKAKDEIDKELNSEIIKTVSANNLINIVGITTTSRQEITINGERREIFTDYPIDFAVIDEVSKSITPEVIQISSLSSKFLYAGDYRQLPPAMDIPSTYISEFWKWEKAQERDNQFDKILKERNISDEEEFEELLNDLYDGTLFKNQVIKLKSGEHSESSYVALDVQHRFTDEIQDLVNVVYDDSEKLSQY